MNLSKEELKNKEDLISTLCDQRAQKDNIIDLNAYCLGLEDMYTRLTEELKEAKAYREKVEEVIEKYINDEFIGAFINILKQIK